MQYLKNKLKIKRALAVIICCAVLSGCYGPEEEYVPKTEEPKPVVAEEVILPSEGGVLTVSMRHPKTLNPILNEDKTVDDILKLVFEPLVKIDDMLRPVPNLAESVVFDSDGRGATIVLKEDIFWSDGEELTSADVTFTIEMLKNAPEGVIYKESARNIASCQPVDNHTVKITYVQPYCGSYYRLMFPVIPAHYYSGQYTPGSLKNMEPIGNGLFIFKEYENMKQLTLEKSESCFKGKAYINSVTAVITPDYETDLHAFENGITNAISLNVDVWSKYGGNTKEINLAEYDSSYFDFIGFNFNSEILKKLNVRRAIDLCLSRDEVMTNVYLSNANATCSPVNPSSWLYDHSLPSPDYDIERAKTELQKASIMFNDGQELRILVNEENEQRMKLAGVLRDNLAKIDVPSRIEAFNFDEYKKRLEIRDFDVFIGGFNMSIVPDLTFMLHSEQAGSGTNYFDYVNEEMDRLLNITFRATGEYELEKSLADIQQLIANDLPFISIAFKKTAVITNKDVLGEKRPVLGNGFNDINTWFIKQDKADSERSIE